MVSHLKTFAHKGCKIATQKKISFLANFALLAGFFGIGATIRIDREILCLPYVGFLNPQSPILKTPVPNSKSPIGCYITNW